MALDDRLPTPTIDTANEAVARLKPASVANGMPWTRIDVSATELSPKPVTRSQKLRVRTASDRVNATS